MGTLNIGGNEQDRFYRYKMPKLISKIEGKGNGIKTVVPNMSDIARSLGRPASYPTKFFGCELGAQVKVDDKNDRYIVNGAHDATRLQELLDGFIRKFVLCAGCNNPETDLIVLKNDKIIRDCKACGHRTDVDMRHKLVTFILKNPPVPKGKAAKGANNVSNISPSNGGKKDSRKASRKNGHEEPDSPTTPTKEKSNDYEDESDDELTRRIEAEAAELPTASHDGDDDDWAVDTSEEAVRARLKDLEGGVQAKLAIHDDEDDDDDDNHGQLTTWLEENPSATNNDIYRMVKSLGIKESNQILKTIVLGLFDESLRKDSAIGKQVKKRGKLLKKFVTSVDDQRLLLGAIEALVGEKHTELLESKIICKILMEFYQNDLLEEDALQAWIAGPDSAKYKVAFKKSGNVMFVSESVSADVRSKAMPFSKWLEEAEEEEEEDDDDEEDDE